MENLERTLKNIPISEIESIIFDDNTFCDFIKNSGFFSSEDKIDYLNAINQYMEYEIRHTTGLPRSIFDRVNYLNNYYVKELGIRPIFDYEEYLDNTIPIVPVNLVEDILSRDDLYKKFLDFEHNRNIFPEHLTSYLYAITDFVNYYDKKGKNITLDNQIKVRFEEIMKQYSLDYKTHSILNGYIPQGGLDPSIVERVLGDKYRNREGMSTFDKFAMCRDIYIELCKIVDYDVTFSAYKQDINNPIVRDIYYKDTGSVTLENNNVICKTWAEMYALLLGMVGIKAKVDGKFHKFVVFDCDGTLMKADATNNMLNVDTGLFMCDLAAIQMGLPTAGFCCDEEYKDVYKQIRMADMKNRYEISTQDSIFEQAKNSYYKVDENQLTDNIEEKIQLLNNICKNSNIKGIQLLKYYSIMFDKLFNRVEKNNIFFDYIAFRNNDYDFDAGVLLSRKIDEENYEYYVFFRNGGTQKIYKEAVETLLRENNFVVFGKNKKIPGIEYLQQEEVNHGMAC